MLKRDFKSSHRKEKIANVWWWTLMRLVIILQIYTCKKSLHCLPKTIL